MANQISTLEGLYKDRYADKVQDLVPDHVKLFNAVKFDSSKKVGAKYNEPVILSLESGFTYGSDAGELFNLNDVKEFKMKNAEIKARELVLRSAISIGALNRSASNDQAIEKAMDLMVGNMLKSMYHRLEVQMFYGQSGIGAIKTADTTATSQKVLEIKDTEWAAGIWNGTTGAEIEIFDPALGTKRLSADVRIKGYSLANKTVTIEKVNGNNFASPADDISVDDVIFFKGAAEVSNVKNEFLGVHGIATENSSLFGIANANEPLFQGSVVNVGTNATTGRALLSFAKIEEGISAMVEKGLMQEQVSAYVNPKQWDDLMTELSAKRSIDSSYSSAKLQSGSKDIEFHSQNGMVKIISSTFVKEGYAYLLCEKKLKRIGSTEVTFKRHDSNENIFQLLEGKNGYEMRCYTDQALFTSQPASICLLRYIKTEA